MAKAATLDIDLEDTAHQPPAATAPRRAKEKGREEAPQLPARKNDTAVNFKWPAADVKAMKREALESDMTIQDFLLSCFHDRLQARKKAAK